MIIEQTYIFVIALLNLAWTIYLHLEIQREKKIKKIIIYPVADVSQKEKP